jgi:hypothetical protein
MQDILTRAQALGVTDHGSDERWIDLEYCHPSDSRFNATCLARNDEQGRAEVQAWLDGLEVQAA